MHFSNYLKSLAIELYLSLPQKIVADCYPPFGSASTALQLLEENEGAIANDVLEFVRAAATGDFERIEQSCNSWKKSGRESVKGFVEGLCVWIRDLSIFRETGSKVPLSYPSNSTVYEKFWTSFPDADLEEMLRAAESMVTKIDRNVSLNLLFFTLSESLRNAMKGSNSIPSKVL